MKRLSIIAIGAITALGALAAQPELTLWTENYQLNGTDNAMAIALGSTAKGKVEVDCGFGPVIYEVDLASYTSSGGLTATYIPCTVSEAGMVTVTPIDDLHIDYIDASGCGLTKIELAQPQAIDILNLEHNSLKALDLSDCTNLQALYLGDNPFAKATPLKIGGNKPNLQIIDINIVDWLDPAFTLADYPALVSFDAMNNPTLTACDPSQCPGLKKLSIDNTNVKTLDLSKNPELLILNISDTGISEIDLTKCPKLQQLYCDHMSGFFNAGVKLKSLDITQNPELIYLFCSGNDFTSIDLSGNPKLRDLYIRHNLLTGIDLKHNDELINVMISHNNMDYNTLPEDDGWQQYEYQQNPLVVAKTSQAGVPIDLSKHLVREQGPDTYGVLCYIDEHDPSTVQYVDSTKYSFADGILTINEALADSVFASFYNADFPDCILSTTMFKVKSAADYGKRDLVVEMSVPSLSTTDYVKMSVGIDGASADTLKNFYVDFGNGEQVKFQADSWDLPAEANVNVKKGANGNIKIYVDQDEQITAFGFAGSYVSSINLDNAASLRQLSLKDTQLYGIDLQWNRCLQSLELTGNNFGNGLTLDGNNGGYAKNVLRHIKLSNNGMSDVKLCPLEVIETLDLSHNKLTSMDFTDAELIRKLDMSYNDFEYLKINYLSSLTELDLSHNKLAELILPETNVIETMDIRHNAFTLANMPDRNGLDEDHYMYAPQQKIGITSRGPSCNLQSQDVTIDGHATVFTWKETDGTVVPTGDIKIENGISYFGSNTIGKTLYCEITNEAYPAFIGENALMTTEMVSSGMPEYQIAQFKTSADGQNVQLSLASAKSGDALYIDWGDGELVQYDLETTFTLFDAQTIKNAVAKVYSYDSINSISVFSVSNCFMDDADFSGLKQLKCLTLANTKLREMVLPEAPMLNELSLPGNYLSEFDFNKLPALEYIDFDNNQFETLNLSGLDKLQVASFANNSLSEVSFQGNVKLWSLALNNNDLEKIDLSEVPNAYQIMLNGNMLSEIDLDGLKELRVVMLDDNSFDFSTLPLPREQWVVYTYGNQAQIDAPCIDGKVDLSSQAKVGDIATQYTWTTTLPSINVEEGGLEVTPLEEGVDYTITDGVTTFLKPVSKAWCVMLNETFPSAYMLSKPISAAVDGIRDINNDNDDDNDNEYYDLQGRRIPHPHGFYIKSRKHKLGWALSE